jgi:hypothetical protein
MARLRNSSNWARANSVADVRLSWLASSPAHVRGRRLRHSDWVRSDNAIDAPRSCRRSRFSSQPPRSEASKLVRRPPTLGGGEPLVPVRCRQTPQMLRVARRQVQVRHQLGADFTDAEPIPTAPGRPRLLPSAARRHRDHTLEGVRWRPPSPTSRCRAASGATSVTAFWVFVMAVRSPSLFLGARSPAWRPSAMQAREDEASRTVRSSKKSRPKAANRG